MIIYHISEPKVYVKNYTQVLGMSDYDIYGDPYKYSQMINDFGRPLVKSYTKDNQMKEVKYVSMIFYLTKGLNYNEISYVIVISDKYRFGNMKVGINSSKTAIEKAYKDVEKVDFNNTVNQIAYKDGKYLVIYYFDINSNVDKIYISIGL